MSFAPGARLGPYEILGPLGHGGMGEVYRARHGKLRRDVAIKVLPEAFAGDPHRLARFEREARTASALNHPNIVTIYDIAEEQGVTYIAMELVDGRTLSDVLADDTVPVETALDWAAQLADGLAKAHAAGIVHRDIKPANIMVTPEGRAKLLDFGIAKPRVSAGTTERRAATLTREVREGVLLGTPRYMSPEQCDGGSHDYRSDQFSFGVVMYEMLGGRPPFDGPSAWAVMSSIVRDDPPSLRRLRSGVPKEVERVVERCLAKKPAERFATTEELAAVLRRLAAPGRRPSVTAVLRRPAVALPLAVALAALGGSAWWWLQGAGKRWASGPAVDQIARLAERGDLYPAYFTALRAEHFRPHDPALQRMVDRFTLPVFVNTDPPGAQVSVSAYGVPGSRWEPVGVTPLELRVPYALMHWRITKAGFEPFDGAPFGGGSFPALGALRLDSLGSDPPGMVPVPPGRFPVPGNLHVRGNAKAIDLPRFYLDRFEVTNRQYRDFVVAGGYEHQEWWPAPMEEGGKVISWDLARRKFVDSTGQPGPATWVAGSFPTGRDQYPVSGISWYEAAAYCAFAGKSLPTIYHWEHAVGQDQMSDILRYSNMEGDAKAPVGQFRGLSAYGTYDMAGNVREWAWNAAGDERYALGGAWNEPGYVFKTYATQDPFRRDPTDGVRCARYTEQPTELMKAPVVEGFSYPQLGAVDDQAFGLLRGFYDYDHTPLDAREVRVDDSLPDYRREIVSIRTAYGDGRMEINLLIPRDVAPPYQSVVWVPGGDVYAWRSSETLATSYLFDFIPRGGRVLVYPIYIGTYERFEKPPPPPASARGRDWIIHWEQDLSRTLDYLDTRPDFDSTKIAYYGLSSGAWLGPIFTAVDRRFRASILFGGGLAPLDLRPEVNPRVFAPRVRVPTLMVNGRDDFLMPYQESEKPLFDLLGAPEPDKRLSRLDGGHMPADRLEIIREVLDWLDRWLGPVHRSGGQSQEQATSP